jgi:signal peptidase I
LAGLWLLFLAPTGLGGPVSLIWVSGISMEPTLHTGDLAVLYERSSYDVGEIVAFEIPEGGTVIHRVVRVVPEGYKFRGDNRSQDDPWVLNEEAIRGQQILSIPSAAKAMTFLGQPHVMAGLVAALVILSALKRSSSTSRAA